MNLQAQYSSARRRTPRKISRTRRCPSSNFTSPTAWVAPAQGGQRPCPLRPWPLAHLCAPDLHPSKPSSPLPWPPPPPKLSSKTRGALSQRIETRAIKCGAIETRALSQQSNVVGILWRNQYRSHPGADSRSILFPPNNGIPTKMERPAMFAMAVRRTVFCIFAGSTAVSTHWPLTFFFVFLRLSGCCSNGAAARAVSAVPTTCGVSCGDNAGVKLRDPTNMSASICISVIAKRSDPPSAIPGRAPPPPPPPHHHWARRTAAIEGKTQGSRIEPAGFFRRCALHLSI